MLKVLDNYKKGVDYFDSFGLDKRAKTSQGIRKPTLAEATTFWDYN